MTIAAVSQWLSTNQLLVFSLIIPLSSGVIAYFSALLSARRALKENKATRSLQKQLKLADFRVEWINELRSDLVRLQAAIRLHRANRSPETEREIVQMTTAVILRMNPDDKDYDALSLEIRKGLEYSVKKGDEDSYEIAEVARSILKREWERLKSDLDSSDRLQK
jgi:replicative superfamily II helicase